MGEERADKLPLTKPELKKLLAGLEKQTGIHSMLNLILCSGMSPEEALSIRLEDIDYNANIIHIYDKYLSRKRTIILHPRIMKLVHEHHFRFNGSKAKLYEVSLDTVENRLYNLSKERLKNPITWAAIRRTWAVLAFDAKISLKSMMETSGASAQQLAVWSLWHREGNGNKGNIDLLAELYS